jgi:hypothetical protein
VQLSRVRRRLYRHSSDFYTDGALINAILVLCASPGTGKSYNATLAALDCGFPFFYSGPLHRTVEQVVRFPGYTDDIIHIESPDRACDNAMRKRLYGKLSKFTIVCKDCPDRHECSIRIGIRRVFRERKSVAVVHQQLMFLLPILFKKYPYLYDIGIIDEMPAKSLVQSLNFTLTVIREIKRQIMTYLHLDDEVNIFMRFLDLMEHLTRNLDENNYDNTLRQIYDVLRVRRINWKRVERNSERIDKELYEEYKDTGIPPSANHFGIMTRLCKAIVENGFSYFLSMIERRPNYRMPGFNTTLKRYALEYLGLSGKRLVYLDGTERPEVTDQLFPGRHIIRKVYLKDLTCKIFQMSSGNYPMSSIEWNPFNRIPIFNKTGLILLESFRAAAELEEMEPDRKLLAVGRKRYEPALMNIMEDVFGNQNRFGFTNYGAVLGDRRWEGFTSVFLFGTPFISDQDMRNDSVLMRLNPDPQNDILWETVIRPKMIDIYTVIECVQAIFRIRPLQLEELGIECRIYTTIKMDLGIGGEIMRFTPDGLLNYLEREINSRLTGFKYDQISGEIIDLINNSGINTDREIMRELQHRNSLIQFILRRMAREGKIRRQTIG